MTVYSSGLINTSTQNNTLYKVKAELNDRE